MMTRHESSSSSDHISLSQYGSVGDVSLEETDGAGCSAEAEERRPLHADAHVPPTSRPTHLTSFASLKDVASRVAFLDSTKTHHYHGAEDEHHHHHHREYESPLQLPPARSDSDDSHREDGDESSPFSHANLRRLAVDLSLYINLFILATKAVAYAETLSLSVLAALVDSALDVVSQGILAYTERRSSKTRSSAHYPAGASRLEPLGVLSCAALMGFASFGVLKEAAEGLWEGLAGGNGGVLTDENWSSFWSMAGVVVVKLGLWALCQRVGHVRVREASGHSSNGNGGAKYYVDSLLEALAQDHWNDCLSNAVAAIALLCAFSNERLWILDPIGAIIISLYIIFSWYSTGREQIEQLTGKAAPRDFIDELYETANNFDPKMEVDVVRAYHFGPKFLVELEVVLPRDTLLFESHDLGMELQYEIESREEVERCFVHIDYESRPYDEHVVSKVPELRERYRPYKQMNSAVSI
ncbi:hypothetical protein ACHAXT_000675 [Thalassiosira profunda]